MRKDRFLQKIVPVLVSCVTLWSQGLAWAADPPPEKTIVLDESRIKGESAPGKESGGGGPADARPALSTHLAWEGEEGEETDLSQEILRQLTQPDSLFLSGEGLEEGDLNKGD
ncbi:MAG: hypothetical protein HY282_10065 [Nitrospirae bacterium]|nr:hypothetical protein [Candidatus Manganitrophaceae bacterium]